MDDAYAEELAPRFEGYGELNPDLRSAVATAYARVNGEEAKKPLMDLVKTLQGEVDRAKVWGALCRFRDPALVEETLALGLSGEVSRSDSTYPISYAASNPDARDVYWRWLTKNYERVRTLYAGSQSFYLLVARVLPVCGVNRVGETKRFLSRRRMREGGSTFTRALEHLEINSRLRRRLLRR